MAEEQQEAKLAGARERAVGVARSAGTARTFVAMLIVLLTIILIVQNWALVRISVFGITFDLPGTLWYALLFACGGLVGVWFGGRWRAR